jgi:hypothetical protein
MPGHKGRSVKELHRGGRELKIFQNWIMKFMAGKMIMAVVDV